MDVELRLERHEDVKEALVAAADEVDLTVLGATREPLFRRLVAGELPEAVAQEATSMIIMVRRNVPGRSRVRR